MSRWPCKDYLKGTCNKSFCEKWHLQNACSRRPRVVAGLGKSAHMHTVRLMNSRLKGPKRMMTKVIGMKVYGNLLSTMVTIDQGRPGKKRDPTHGNGLCISRHEAADVYSPEELRHAETNPMRKIHEGYCASH